jgi:hypothetical protein
MSQSSIDLVLATFNMVFGSSVVAGIFLIAVSLILFCVFLLVVVGLAYIAAWLWAGYEEDFDNGDDKKFAFKEKEVLAAVSLALANLASTLGALVSLFVSTGSSVASSLAANPITLIVGVLVFALVVVVSTYITTILGGYFEALACFVHPVVRTLFLPPLETGALTISSVLPLWNALRQLTASIGTETILDTLVCAGGQTLIVIENASAVLVRFVTELIFWARSGSGFSPLDVGPNFFPVGAALGRLISSLDQFAECACEPVFDVAVQPFFSAFETPQFAQAVNSTLGLTFVFLTQPLLGPAIRTFENFEKRPNAEIEANIVRPSFNSTFDVAALALNSTAQVFDLQTGALVQVVYNIIGASVQSCPSGYGLTNTRRCTASKTIEPSLNGTCVAGQCRVEFLVQTGAGCCATALTCTPNVPSSQCNTAVPGTTFHPGVPCSSLERAGCGSCCFTDITTLGEFGFAGACFSDISDADCRSLRSGVRRFGVDCLKGTTSAPFLTCEDVSRINPAPFPQTEPQSCGTCSGPDNSFCQCSTCACSYAVNPLFTDLPPTIARVRLSQTSANRSALQISTFLGRPQPVRLREYLAC